MKPQLSIIMPHYRDVETTIGTIESLYETIDIDNFEVIVVNDGSGNGFELPDDYRKPNMRYISHFVNNGVGQAFDTGVNIAKSDNLILMGADIRFEKNGWAERMLRVIDKHPKGIIATKCGSTKMDRFHCGADLIFLIENKDISVHHPRKNIPDYRSVLEGKWRNQTDRGVYQVPCLMGAFYGTTKAWYNKVRGFELHYKWGSLESYISLKTWIMGGEILVDSENITYHIFNRRPQRQALWDVLIYNQTLVSSVVFGNYGIKYVNYLSEGDRHAYQRGTDMYMEKIEAVNALSGYIYQNRVMTPEELEKKMVEMSYHYNQEKCKYTDPLVKK